jgi:hypothetical protein
MGDPRKVVVGDMTFHIDRKRTPHRRWKERLREIMRERETVKKSALSDFEKELRDIELSDAAQEIYDDLVVDTVVSVDNLFDREGNPVVWPRGDKAAVMELYEDLDATITNALEQGILARKEQDAETGNASGGSGESPSATSPATP